MTKTDENAFPFRNEPLIDFTSKEEREKLSRAFFDLRKELPLRFCPVVAGMEKRSGREVVSYNPAFLKESISIVSYANLVDAEEAVTSAHTYSAAWKKEKPENRASVLRKAASLLRQKRYRLFALISLEVGKGIKDIDAEIAEAIDFCEFYGVEAEILFRTRERNLPGEENMYGYIPRGVTAVISPWNFPLAILCGMTVAPLVVGNTVIMKPAEQSSAVAFELYNILIQAGVPKQALHFLPGRGEEVGEFLVTHPLIHTVNFTGSRKVGLGMIERASVPKYKFVKRVLAEMGGKNAMIIDEDADLDEAVSGALHSSFGFQGQKCSALSRLIVLDSCYDSFKSRFADALSSWKCGSPEDFSCKIGPVIDSDSRSRLESVASLFTSHVFYRHSIPEETKKNGHYVDPIIFEEKDPKSPLGQDEFFGPYVTLFRVKTFEEGIRLANGTDYALTGGVYSRNPENILFAKENFEVGNLYINRGITGAVVDRQPFGGYKLSGVGSKAGGPDYLKQFLEPISVTENTMRRGFVPE